MPSPEVMGQRVGPELPHQWGQAEPWLLAVGHAVGGQAAQGRLHPREGRGSGGTQRG